jgi:hypothetical protein
MASKSFGCGWGGPKLHFGGIGGMGTKVWGPTAQVDFLSRYFINKLGMGLLDIDPCKIYSYLEKQENMRGLHLKKIGSFFDLKSFP